MKIDGKFIYYTYIFHCLKTFLILLVPITNIGTLFFQIIYQIIIITLLSTVPIQGQIRRSHQQKHSCSKIKKSITLGTCTVCLNSKWLNQCHLNSFSNRAAVPKRPAKWGKNVNPLISVKVLELRISLKRRVYGRGKQFYHFIFSIFQSHCEKGAPFQIILKASKIAA